MARRWLLFLLPFFLTVLVAGGLFAWQGGKSRRVGGFGEKAAEGATRSRTPEVDAPEEKVTPDTLANRALVTAVRKNDFPAALQAFADGASPDVTLTYAFPNKPLNQKTEKPLPLLSLVRPQAADDADRPQAVAIFKQFLDRGVDIKATQEDGRNAIFWAAQLEDNALVQSVLDKGADIQAVYKTNFGGGNIVNLVVAMTLRDHEEKTQPLLKLVLEHGANPNIRDSHGMSPLHTASLLGVPRTVEQLLRHGADPDLLTEVRGPAGINGNLGRAVSALTLAQRSGNDAVIRLLTAAKKELTPIEAATTGNATALKKLLGSGLDPNTKDDTGMPFIVLAAGSGNMEAVQLLLAQNADPNVAGPQGSRALARAAALGHREIVRLLLKRGADPNAIDGTRPDFPETALTHAVRGVQLETVTELLEHGVNINALGNRDALLRSVREAGNAPRRMIGQDPKAVKRGAAARDAQSAIYELLAAKTDLRKSGGPVLCAAIERNQYPIARDLIQRGADINSRKEGGQTAVMLVINDIGMIRDDLDGETLKSESLPGKEWRDAVKERDKEAIEFLRFLLSRHPNLNIVVKGADDAPLPDAAGSQSGSKGETALSLARFWKLPDVVTLLKKSGAR